METKVYKEIIREMKKDLKQIGADIRVAKVALKEKQRAGNYFGPSSLSESDDARYLLNAYCMVRNVPYKAVESKVRDGNQLWAPDVHDFVKKYFKEEVSREDVKTWLTL